MNDAADGEHSKAAVLDLRELKTAKQIIEVRDEVPQPNL